MRKGLSMNHLLRPAAWLILALTLPVSAGYAQQPSRMALPAPQTTIGKPVMEVFALRQSIREYAEKPLPAQELSNLLWAAWGINRADGRRTAPSAVNYQEIELYVLLPDGAYRYNAQDHALDPMVAGDQRKSISPRDVVVNAPVVFAYVADFSKMRGGITDGNMVLAHTDACFISENVYLYAASQGLGTVVMGSINREVSAKALNLGETQFVTYAQPVGYQRSE